MLDVPFQLWEWLALPLYLLVVLVASYFHQRKKKEENALYRFYSWGLFAHIFGALFFGLIYEYYYGSGDTFGYFLGGAYMDKLLFHSPTGWFLNEFQAASKENYLYFNEQTGYPWAYMYYDPRTWMVIRFINPIILPSFGSYLLATVIIAWICYTGIWKLYLVFTYYYPRSYRTLAIAILFFPSVLFWSSGILKDTIMLCCTGWVVYCMQNIFILKKRRLWYTVILLANLYLILIIKPYIIFALLPGSMMWIFSSRIYRIKNVVIRMFIVPFILLVCAGGGYLVLSQLGGFMGKYSLDKITTTAIVTQTDLKKAYYQGHSFDIGLNDDSYTGMLKKSPQAFVAGIYRPFLWESENIVMLMSAMENTFILLLTLLLILRTNILTIISRLFAEPLLFFAFTYSVFFGAIVGLTTSNFGALTRFKTAYISFFVASVFILLKKKEDPEIATA